MRKKSEIRNPKSESLRPLSDHGQAQSAIRNPQSRSQNPKAHTSSSRISPKSKIQNPKSEVSYIRQPRRTEEYKGLKRWGLFRDAVFGPVASRRFGRSLGVNPLPPGHKICSFDCVYCECGRSERAGATRLAFPPVAELARQLESALRRLKSDPPDTITLCGNGEPTLHPRFASLLATVRRLRQRWAPAARIAVLTNGTGLRRRAVAHALARCDEVMLKLDAGDAATLRAVNAPLVRWSPSDAVRAGRRLGRVTVQALFVCGRVNNARPAQIAAWLRHLRRLSPARVVLYTLDRIPPIRGLRPVPAATLERIARQVTATGLTCETR